MKKPFTFCFITISAILFSCKKDVTELPPATQSGANTFGCKIDGGLWVPSGFGIVPTAPKLEARIAGTHLYVNARNFASSPTESEFEFFIKDITVHGNSNYTLTSIPAHPSDGSTSYAYYVHRRFNPDNEWLTTSSTYTGTVTITKVDTINHFVSGTFDFQAINLYNAPQPINVTEGRFDVKIQ